MVNFIGNPTEELSVSIDGVRLADVGVHLLRESEEPMLPELRSHSVNIPGRHGAYDFGAYFEPRSLTLACGFNQQASFHEVQALIRRLSAMLLDAYGRPKEVTLEYDYERGKFYKARLANGVSLSRIVRAGLFSIPMIAHDPYAYSAVHADEITWGSRDITFEYSYLLGHENTGGEVRITSPTTLRSVFVDGYAVSPIFEINGSATSLTISANGNMLRLPSFTNARWVIDCERFTVTRNGDNAFDSVTIGKFSLLPGANVVTVGGSSINVDMRIKYRDKYM